MSSPIKSLRSFARERMPNDVFALLRKRFGTPRPWDPGAILPPPDCAPGELVGPPDFIGIGTQKSGTSWWYNTIASHPMVHDVSSAHKERHYFSRYFDQPFTNDDIDAYHRWFPRPPGSLVGEWTPHYMHQPWAPQLISRAAPNAKLLVLLRDPIERYRSGLTHYAARKQDLDSRLAIDAIDRGMYAKQLERVYASVPKDQVLVLQYEACRADPKTAAATTFDFLGLDPTLDSTGIESEVNATKIDKVPLPDHLRSTLREMYQADIAALCELAPTIDVDLWPNFTGRP